MYHEGLVRHNAAWTGHPKGACKHHDTNIVKKKNIWLNNLYWMNIGQIVSV